MRVNANIQSPGDFPPQVDKVNPRSIRGGFQLSPKLPGQVPPRTFSYLKSNDTAAPPVMSAVRPGADNHLLYKSKGF